jgi:hypothetical protein
MATEKEIFISINGTQTAVKNLDDLTKATEELAEGFKEAGDAAGDAQKEIAATGGGGGKLSKGLKAIGRAGKSAFKGIGTAIKASGIGLLVAIVAKLIEQFTKTDTGAKILQGSLAVLGVIFEQVEKVLQFIIDNIVKAFTDPQQAVEDLRAGVELLSGWFSSIGDYIKNNFILLIQKFQAKVLEARIAWNDFTGDSEEAQKLTAELEAINKEIDTTREKIAEAAEEVAEPFVAAANLIATVVTEIIEESQAAISASNEAIDAANRFAALQNELIVQNAELTKQLEEQKKISEDTTRSYDERKEALDKVNAANEQLAENALIEAQALENKVRLQLQIASNDEDRRALESELASATAERIAREQEAEIVRLESAQLNRELDQEEIDRKKFINDTIRGLEIENIENEKEAANAALDLAEQTLLAELDAVRATEEQKQLVRDEFAKKRSTLNKTSSEEAIDLAKKEAEKRQMIADKAFSVLSDLATLFAKTDEANAEKNFKVQKAIGISQAAINTGLAVTAALTAGGNIIKLATGAQFVEAGIAAVAGAAQIAAIARTKFKGGGGATPPPGPPAAPTFDPTAAINAQNDALTGTQDPGAAVTPGGANPAPIRAYVVATEVTSQQEANAQIDNLATL